MTALGKALFIVNPVSQNGRAAQAAAHIRYSAKKFPNLADSVEVYSTNAPFHAIELASQAAEYDSVVALGGDGILHEVLTGLMKIPADQRPALGLIPCGNGNDYARTIGMSTNLNKAFEQLSQAYVQYFDLGVCNGEYFAETFSFGLDAAIAIGTHERRKRTGLSGTPLFIAEGLDHLKNRREIYHVTLSLDGAPAKECDLHMSAFQIGKTYGGGFKICPQADPHDGLLDICMVHAPLGFTKATMIFAKAIDGRHLTHTKNLTFTRAKSVVLEFDEEPPAQMDGELVRGSRFEISTLKQELAVLVP